MQMQNVLIFKCIYNVNFSLLRPRFDYFNYVTVLLYVVVLFVLYILTTKLL